MVALAAAPALAGDDQNPPEPPFVNLSEDMRARSTYIFQFAENVPPSRMPAHAAALTRAVGGELRHTYTNVVGGFAATMTSVAMLRLLERAGDDIVSVERDQVDSIVGKSGACDFEPPHPSCKEGGGGTDDQPPASFVCKGNYGDFIPWGVRRIGAVEAHKDTDISTPKCGRDVHVYVIDTGIDLDHPDLAPIGKSVDCTKGPSCEKGGDGGDDNGHGTHVAGTVAARINDIQIVGVAPAAVLHAVKVLRSSGIGFRSDVIAGIDWVASQIGSAPDSAPVVVNMSLSGSGGKSGICDKDGFRNSTDPYHEAICDATHAGAVFAVAAGNEGADAANAVPAAYDDTVITVSATNGFDDWPDWSNWGNDLASWTAASAPVAIAAPGVEVLSTSYTGGTTRMTGTSMASPHVAGAVALHLEGKAVSDFGTGYDVFTAVRAAVTTGSEDTDTSVWSNTSGHSHNEDFLDAECLTDALCYPGAGG